MAHAEVDIYAEQGVLANVFASPKVIEDVSEIINETDFKEPRHQKIYEVIANLFREGKGISTPAVAAELRADGILHEVGGIEYLHQLADPTAPYTIDGDGVTYAQIVRDESNRRAIYSVGRELAQTAALGSGMTIPEIMAAAQKSIHTINERVNISQSITKLGGLLDDAFIRIDERSRNDDGIQGVPSGLIDLDSRTSGFQPGNFVVIAARPGIGKSTLAVDFARAASIKAGLTTAIFSLEMSQAEITDRILAAEGNVLLKSIRSGTVDERDWDALRTARTRLEDAKLYIDDSPNITMDHIRLSCIRQAATEEGLDLVIVDYLQLMKSPGKTESRQQEVSEFSRSLKLLGRELGCPVIALSQLNRGSENRQDKRPKLSDLRESGAIEQDADIVLLLHRPEGGDMPGGEQSVLIIGKNRNGENDVNIPLSPLLQYAKFASGTGQFPPPVEDELRHADPVAFSGEPGPQDPVQPPDDEGDGAISATAW